MRSLPCRWPCCPWSCGLALRHGPRASLSPWAPFSRRPSPTAPGTACRDFPPVLPSCPSNPTLASLRNPTTDLTAPPGQTRARRPGRRPGCRKAMPPARVGPVGGPGPKPEATSENETQSPFRLGAARGPGLGLRERRAPGCPIVTGKGGGGAPHFSESGTKCRHMAWPSAALSPGQLPAWPSCPAVTRLRTQVGSGPVLGPRRSGQLRKLVTLPRADSQARARSLPTVPWPVPFLPWDPPPGPAS